MNAWLQQFNEPQPPQGQGQGADYPFYAFDVGGARHETVLREISALQSGDARLSQAKLSAAWEHIDEAERQLPQTQAQSGSHGWTPCAGF